MQVECNWPMTMNIKKGDADLASPFYSLKGNDYFATVSASFSAISL